MKYKKCVRWQNYKSKCKYYNIRHHYINVISTKIMSYYKMLVFTLYTMNHIHRIFKWRMNRSQTRKMTN